MTVTPLDNSRGGLGILQRAQCSEVTAQVVFPPPVCHGYNAAMSGELLRVLLLGMGVCVSWFLFRMLKRGGKWGPISIGFHRRPANGCRG